MPQFENEEFATFQVAMRRLLRFELFLQQDSRTSFWIKQKQDGTFTLGNDSNYYEFIGPCWSREEAMNQIKVYEKTQLVLAKSFHKWLIFLPPVLVQLCRDYAQEDFHWT
jgi:hypothetical protein